jgi:hypothetical protein
VSYCDTKLIADRAFGGQIENYDKLMVQHANDLGMRTVLRAAQMKEDSAYLLIYERKQFIDQDRFIKITDPKIFQGDDYSLESLHAFNACILPEARL